MLTVLDGRYTAKSSVVALGMFDGVHIGHQVLIQKGRALADQRGVPLVVSTFREHPLSVIAPQSCPAMLATFDERVALMESMGVDVLYAMPFDRAVMDMPPEEYVGRLVRQFHPTDVVCGYNHTFGKKGGGTPALLAVLGGALGFCTAVVPKITLRGREVSSTAIRERLRQGDAAGARELLGRPYPRRAVVAGGHGNVWELAFAADGKQELPNGAYRVLCGNGARELPAVLRLRDGGRAECRLPGYADAAQTLTVRFLSNLSVDF